MADKAAFINAIEEEYRVHWIADNLPVGQYSDDNTAFQRGFPVGMKSVSLESDKTDKKNAVPAVSFLGKSKKKSNHYALNNHVSIYVIINYTYLPVIHIYVYLPVIHIYVYLRVIHMRAFIGAHCN